MTALGVAINRNKSLLVTGNERVSEFVKRNSFDGDEITVLSPALITKSFLKTMCVLEN